MTNISDSPLFPNSQKEYSEGDLVFINNKTVLLGECIGHGGEGTVFDLTGTNKVVKLYHHNLINKRQIEKLKLIVNAKISSNTLIAPIDLVFNDNKEIIGYSMMKVIGRRLDDVLITDGQNYTRREIVRLALNIVKAYQELDSNSKYKVLAGDINPNNVIVYNKSNVSLIDLDSIQINEFPCPVGFSGYSLPSAIGKNYRNFLRTEENEQFALAVLIFFVLIHKHPFDQINGEDPDSNILKLSFPYSRNTSNCTNAPLKFLYRWKCLDESLQTAFCKIFNSIKGNGAFEGISFAEWNNLLLRYLETLNKIVPQNKLFDIYELTYDPFSKEKVCLACGKPFSSNTDSDLCQSCIQLGITEAKCSNPFCTTSQKIFYIPRSRIGQIRYCHDCLSIVEIKCKKCSITMHVRKYQTHDFDTTYCSKHRGPAKGRLTKAKNRIKDEELYLGSMFENGRYNSTTIASALNTFQNTYSNLFQDNDIIDVCNVLLRLRYYIAEIRFLSDSYKNWMKVLCECEFNEPKNSDSLSQQLSELENIRKIFDTLFIPLRDNKKLAFSNTIAGKFLPNRFDVVIQRLKKMHFKKCSNCGKEERDDLYLSQKEPYYCSDCSKVEVYKCPRCGLEQEEKRYNIAKLKTSKDHLCLGCKNDFLQLEHLYATCTAADFEQITKFEEIDFIARRRQFSEKVGFIYKKVETFNASGIKFEFDKKI